MGTGNDILQALDAFIRKYYKNLLLKGLLCGVGIVGGLFLAEVLIEHFGWLSPLWRAVLFWGGLAVVAAVLLWLVVRPWVKMHGLGRRIGYNEAARIVGRHFPEVDDRLLNLLQLMEAGGDAADDGGLLLAAIEQKTAQLRPVPMLKAVDLKKNRRYLRYALPPLVAIAALLLLAPRTITEPTRRIANYSKEYERPAPFAFRVENDELRVQSGQDYVLKARADGEAVPDEAYLSMDGYKRRMRKTGSGHFEYTFEHLVRTQVFRIEGGGVVSREYVLEAVPKPSVLTFRMLLDYPTYTGREDEVVVDLGDAAVPEGTRVRWLFQTADADTLSFGLEAVERKSAVDANGRVEESLRVMYTTAYAFSVSNGDGVASDTLHYLLSAIADAAPMIAVEELTDSLHPDRRLFRGRIKDDYGFTRLVFAHQATNRADTAVKSASEAEIALNGGLTQEEFYFSFNTAELVLAPGDELSYWFEVSDNDAIHGPKTTKSQVFEIKVPTAGELDSLLDQGVDDVKESAEVQMSELRRLQQEIDEMMRRLVDKKELGWQDKKDLQQIAEKQKQVRTMMQQMQRQIEENNRLEQKYRQQSEQLMEKQRELDRLMNEVMDEKMKETMAEIERMMQQLDKQKVQQELEQLKVSNEELEKQIDQNIELMKRLEIEKKVEQTIQKMERLADEQREVSGETEKAKGKDNDDLQARQQRLNEQFKQLEEDIDQIKQDYKELDPSTEFNIPKELEQQVEQLQQGAWKNMQKGNNKEAAGQQKEAAEAMDKLSEAIAEAQVDAEQQDLAEDAEQVRQLLKNIVRLSFNQEELISDVNSIYIQDPKYQTVIAKQNRIKDDFRNVDDSLRSMAKRQLQVATAITKNLGEVNSSMSRSLSGLLDMNQSFYGNYKNTQAASAMQYGMTSLNNLALILAESLDQMQDQMRQNSMKKKSGQCKSKGNQQCSNPGRSKPSPKSMREMQQELNKQMEALKKQLDKQGKQQGGRHKIGEQQGMSEEFAKMAAQQEMIRRMMQQYGQEMKQQSAGNGKLAKEIDQMMRQMEQTEADLVNKTITQQTIKRQQQIMTRLLEHEKAEMEREKEERRESREAGELYGQPSPAELEKYNKQMQQGMDQLHSVPPNLQPYYRNKVNDYFYK